MHFNQLFSSEGDYGLILKIFLMFVTKIFLIDKSNETRIFNSREEGHFQDDLARDQQP